VTFGLTLAQRKANRMLGGAETHCKLVGGSRSGKTFLLCRAVATRAVKFPQSNHLIGKLRFNSLKFTIMNGTWPKMMRLCFPDLEYDVNRSDAEMTLPNNSKISFLGLDEKDRVEKILGSEFLTVYLNECSQIAYESVLTVLSRLAQKIDGAKLKAYYDLNPGAISHWTNKLFGTGVDPITGLPVDKSDYCRMFMNPEDNRENLPDAYFKILSAMPERQRMRFLEGKYVSDLPGALWTVEIIESNRVDVIPDMERIVISIDPSGTRGGDGRDEVGIIAAGRGVDGVTYILDDWSCSLPPSAWAARAVALYDKWEADAIVAEQNFGGAMVESTVRTARASIPYREVTASRGKHVRAEPISALYEQGRVRHNGMFPELEEQMVSMTTSGYQGSKSPDRLDAAVWAITELNPNNAMTSEAPSIDGERILAGARPW
jgi:hypothetical protein